MRDVILRPEVVQEWFRRLVRLGGVYDAHLGLITLQRAPYALKLEQVELGAAYTIAFLEEMQRTLVCEYAWHLTDPRHRKAPRHYCMRCMRTHPNDEHPPAYEDNTSLVWYKEDSAKVDLLLGQIEQYVTFKMSSGPRVAPV